MSRSMTDRGPNGACRATHRPRPDAHRRALNDFAAVPSCGTRPAFHPLQRSCQGHPACWRPAIAGSIRHQDDRSSPASWSGTRPPRLALQAGGAAEFGQGSAATWCASRHWLFARGVPKVNLMIRQHQCGSSTQRLSYGSPRPVMERWLRQARRGRHGSRRPRRHHHLHGNDRATDPPDRALPAGQYAVLRLGGRRSLRYLYSLIGERWMWATGAR